MTWEAIPGKRGFRVAEGLLIPRKGAGVAWGAPAEGT